MAVIVSTQYIENYGVFDDSLTNIWKFKGGQTFIVWDTDERPANAVALVAEYIYKKPMGIRSVSDDNIFSFEFPIHWDVQDDEHIDNEILDLGKELKYLFFKKDNLHDYTSDRWHGGSE